MIDKITELKSDCEKQRQRTKKVEEALQKDADHKVQVGKHEVQVG